MKTPAHTHPCATCGKPAECSGQYERNHDGWPTVICDRFEPHPEWIRCDDCAEKETNV